MKIKESIKSLIKDIRIAQEHLAVPAIVGQGWTVTISKGKSNFQNLGNGKYNMAGRFYEGTYYSEHSAINLRDHLKNVYPDSTPSLIHIDDAARVQMESNVELLKSLLPYRNHQS